MKTLDEMIRDTIREEINTAIEGLTIAIRQLQSQGSVIAQMQALLSGAAPVAVPVVKRGRGRPRKNPLPVIELAPAVTVPRVKRKYKKRKAKIVEVAPVKRKYKKVKAVAKRVKRSPAAKKLVKAAKPAVRARPVLTLQQRAAKQATDRARRAAKKLAKNGATAPASATVAPPSPPKAAAPQATAS